LPAISVPAKLDYVNNNFLSDEPIVVARKEQIGRSPRPFNSRRATRLAKKTALGLVGELPALAIVRHLPVTLTERFVSLVRDGGKLGRGKLRHADRGQSAPRKT
jgi:hypothetical protein